jgi:hypothetical protein
MNRNARKRDAMSGANDDDSARRRRVAAPMLSRDRAQSPGRRAADDHLGATPPSGRARCGYPQSGVQRIRLSRVHSRDCAGGWYRYDSA